MYTRAVFNVTFLDGRNRVNTNLFIIKPFLIAEFDCTKHPNLQMKIETLSTKKNRWVFVFKVESIKNKV